jgi:hypothetical protein
VGEHEATWARVEAEGWLSGSDGLAQLDVNLGRSGGRLEVRLEHGPVLWPLDVPAEHRTGLRVGGTPSYDPSLDVAGPTWEKAIVALAALVSYANERPQLHEGMPVSHGPGGGVKMAWVPIRRQMTCGWPGTRSSP